MDSFEAETLFSNASSNSFNLDPGSGDKNDIDGAWGSSSYAQTNSSANLTTDEFLVAVLGPKQLEYYRLIPITIIYAVMFVTGVIGNILVCFVIVHNKSMHTATNYYLFSLAIADLIILLLGLPSELATFWHQYPYLQGVIFCKFRSFASEMASYASVLIIVSFSVERYLAICHPLHMFAMGDFQRGLRVISIDWIVAGLAAVPYLLFTDVNYIDQPMGSGNFLNESAFCALLDQNIYPKGYPIHQLASILFFIIPVGVLLFLYISMAITLHGSFNNKMLGGTAGSVHGERQINSSRKQIIRMLAAVVISFFVCWTPFHTQRLGYVFFAHLQNDAGLMFRTINEFLYSISGICYYASSTMNPILYNMMSSRYRQAFKNTLCGLTGRNLTTQVTIMQSQAPTNGGGLRGYGSHKSNGKTQLFGQHNKQPSKENLLQKHQGPSSPLLGITEETQVNQESRNGTTEHDVMVHHNNGRSHTEQESFCPRQPILNGNLANTEAPEMNRIEGQEGFCIPPKEDLGLVTSTNKVVQFELEPLTTEGH